MNASLDSPLIWSDFHIKRIARQAVFMKENKKVA